MTGGVIMEAHSRGQRSERTPWKLKGQLGYTNTALFNPSSRHRATTQQEGALVTSHQNMSNGNLSLPIKLNTPSRPETRWWRHHVVA